MTAPTFSKVKRYQAMYSTDAPQKKHKRYQDCYVRHHHYNGKLYLLGLDMEEVTSTFYRSASHVTQRLMGTTEGGSSCCDEFVIPEGEEIEFEDGFVAEVGELCFESETNISDIFKATKEARTKAAGNAHEWAVEYDASTPSSKSRPRPPQTGSGSSFNASKGESQAPNPPLSTSTNAAPPAYRGFGIPPPKSYTGGKVIPKSKPGQSSSSTTSSNSTSSRFNTPHSRSSPHTSKTPYARPRPPPPANTDSLTTTPSSLHNPSFSKLKGTINSSLGKPHSVASPFKPPSFIRPPPPP